MENSYIGLEVYWNDPNKKCSGWKIIKEVLSDDTLILTDENGIESIKATLSELT